MIGTIIIDEELGSHFWVEKCAKYRMFLPLHSCNKGSTVGLGHVRDCCGCKHGLETRITCELLWRNTPVMPIICVVMIFKQECNILKLSKHLRVSRIHNERKRQTFMSQVHFLIWITILCCEICQLFKAHACTPKRHISTLVIKCNDLLIEKLSEIIVVSVTSR
jgi:hypothetical protein